jgi:hypothetical protein
MWQKQAGFHTAAGEDDLLMQNNVPRQFLVENDLQPCIKCMRLSRDVMRLGSGAKHNICPAGKTVSSATRTA